MRLSPHSPTWYLQQLSNAYQQMGRYEGAIAAHKQLLIRNPNFLWTYPNLAFSYLAQWGFQRSADPQTLGRADECGMVNKEPVTSAEWRVYKSSGLQVTRNRRVHLCTEFVGARSAPYHPRNCAIERLSQ
jgi:hypothetical protein